MNNINSNGNFLINTDGIVSDLYKVIIRLEKLRIQRDHNTKIMTDKSYGIGDKDYTDSSVDKIGKIEDLLKVLETELKQAVESYC